MTRFALIPFISS